jgi:hypothetical protein
VNYITLFGCVAKRKLKAPFDKNSLLTIQYKQDEIRERLEVSHRDLITRCGEATIIRQSPRKKLCGAAQCGHKHIPKPQNNLPGR